MIANQSINANAQVEFRQSFLVTQLTQATSMLSVGSLIDPVKSLQCSVFMRSRRRVMLSTAIDPFWLAPKVQSWNSAKNSSLVMIKGTFKSRFQIKDFCTNVVELLNNSQIPVVWVLKTIDAAAEQNISTVDLLKCLISQVLRLNHSLQTNFAMSNRLRKFRHATTEKDWFNLLGSVLEGLPRLYIVIDIEILSASLASFTKGFSWPSAFLDLFQDLSDRGLNTVVKVVLVSYGSQIFSETSGKDIRDVVVSVGSSVAGRKPLGKRTPRSGPRNGLQGRNARTLRSRQSLN